MAKHNLELKKLREIVTMMREEDSALGAQRIFEMLYKEEEDNKKRTKSIKIKTLTAD